MGIVSAKNTIVQKSTNAERNVLTKNKKLRGKRLTIVSNRGPLVRPEHVSVATQVDHRLNCEHMAHLRKIILM